MPDIAEWRRPSPEGYCGHRRPTRIVVEVTRREILRGSILPCFFGREYDFGLDLLTENTSRIEAEQRPG
jgi:hypothetical protein